MWAFSKQRVLNITEQLPEYQSEMERNKLNLQTVLFRPLRSHQCSSEWFENWDMSTAQRAINTSHTDKQWHTLYIYYSFTFGFICRKLPASSAGNSIFKKAVIGFEYAEWWHAPFMLRSATRSRTSAARRLLLRKCQLELPAEEASKF